VPENINRIFIDFQLPGQKTVTQFIKIGEKRGEYGQGGGRPEFMQVFFFYLEFGEQFTQHREFAPRQGIHTEDELLICHIAEVDA
jgi:hypothetical protein